MVLQALESVSSFLAVARAVHMTSCAALASVFVFERAVARRCGAIPKRGLIIRTAILLIVISGIAWFAAVTIEMTGLPASEALSRENLLNVLGNTDFGSLWQKRAGIAIGMPIAWLLLRLVRRKPNGIAMLFGSVALLGSLAWAGHGSYGQRPTTHLIADVIHLIVLAIWPAGLLPLWMILRSEIDIARFTFIVNRFSNLALLSVTALIATGWINSWMLIGSWRGLIDTAYGQTLLVKLILLLGMVLLGAANLIYLRPRIATTRNALRLLRINVALEAVLTLGILLVVGYLGILPPSVDL